MDSFQTNRFQSGQIATDPGTRQHYVLKRLETSPSVSDGVPRELSHHHNPCPTIENWTSSYSGPDMLPSQYTHFWGCGTTSQYYTHSTKRQTVENNPHHSLGSAPSDMSPEMVSYSSPIELKYEPGLQDTPSWIKPEDVVGPSETYYDYGPSFKGIDSHYLQQKPDASGAFTTMNLTSSTAYTPATVYTPSTTHYAPSSSAYSTTAFTPSTTDNTPSTAIFTPSSSAVSPSARSFQIKESQSPETKPVFDDDDFRATPMSTEDDGSIEKPYSVLIYHALSEAPGQKLPLQGIYNWFEKNTTKGRDHGSKGWQNSIRHNLSMNAGFEAIKEESTTGKKAINYWQLTEEAMKSGIQSTTRYRKQANHKKSGGSDPPAPLRQRSGAKGGKATKIGAKYRGSSSASAASQDELRRERYRRQRAGAGAPALSQRRLQERCHYPTPSPSGSSTSMALPLPDTIPIHQTNPTTTVSSLVTRHPATGIPGGMENVGGCTTTFPSPLFVDENDYHGLTLDAGVYGNCGPQFSFPNGLPSGGWPVEISPDLPLRPLGV